MTTPYDHVWHWRKWPKRDSWADHDLRKGHRCRVLCRGNGAGPRNALLEFEDGERLVAPRYAVRRVTL